MQIGPQTIYAKGLLLICVPLVLEVVFGLSMFSLQRYYGEKLDKEREAVEVIFHANELGINCTEMMAVKAYFNLFGGERPAFEERTDKIKDNYRKLEALIRKNSLQRENLEIIHRSVEEVLTLIDELKPVSAAHESASGKIKILLSDLDIFSKVQDPISTLGFEIQQFREPEFLRSDSAIPEIERATLTLDRVVLGSFGATALLSVLLFVYFIRSINRGVNVVMENTERFKKGQELNPPSQEGDELAQVDVAFHEMAAEIKEAQRTKQSVVSMISHDLRTPLTAVIAYLQNVTDGVFGDVAHGTVSDAQHCERDVEKLIGLINDLLDLDKIEAGKLELRCKSLPVENVIDKAIGTMNTFAQKQGVTVHGAESSVEIYADPDRMVQALANVLSTAVRLSPTGALVETRVGKNNGDAEISVVSAGASVSEDRLVALFDRYQEHEDGLRLELPISNEIIKLHGGTIGAVSGQPQGLTFLLRVPSHAPVA